MSGSFPAPGVYNITLIPRYEGKLIPKAAKEFPSINLLSCEELPPLPPPIPFVVTTPAVAEPAPVAEQEEAVKKQRRSLGDRLQNFWNALFRRDRNDAIKEDGSGGAIKSGVIVPQRQRSFSPRTGTIGGSTGEDL